MRKSIASLALALGLAACGGSSGADRGGSSSSGPGVFTLSGDIEVAFGTAAGCASPAAGPPPLAGIVWTEKQRKNT